MNPQEIKNARKEFGFTQDEMANALGLTSSMTYSKWETGERKPSASAIASIKMLKYIKSTGFIDGWLSLEK